MGIFLNPTKHALQKTLLMGKFGAEILVFVSVFPGEGKSRSGYVLETSGYACVQHNYSSGPWGILRLILLDIKKSGPLKECEGSQNMTLRAQMVLGNFSLF